MNSAETNLTTETEQSKAESSEINLNPCQTYKIDPITSLHLCQTCPYHQYRNETKPWLKKGKE